jgi:hypothetical protein
MASDFQWTHARRRMIHLRDAGKTIALLMQTK